MLREVKSTLILRMSATRGGVPTQLIYGTTNSAKVQHMRDMLEGMDIEVAGLEHRTAMTVDIDETGNNPLENARIKALAYFDLVQALVFSCDSGLYIEGLSSHEQPGVHIRRVKGKELSDEQMLEYYSTLASKFGGKVKARYRNAICLVMNPHTIYEYDGEDMASEEFIITSKPHQQRVEGFPLDSLSVDCKTNKYYFDLEDDDSHLGKYDPPQTNGFRRFFERVIGGVADKLPILRSERLILRPFRLSDAKRVQELAGSKAVASTTLNIPHPYADGVAEEWITNHEKNFQDRHSLTLAICLKESDELIGCIGLLLSVPDQNASLGYWIGEPYWNQGYCTEAAKVMIKYAFEQLDLHRVFATHISHNPASGRVMTKLGTKQEGVLRDHVCKWGKHYDLIYYGILKSEYM